MNLPKRGPREFITALRRIQDFDVAFVLVASDADQRSLVDALLEIREKNLDDATVIIQRYEELLCLQSEPSVLELLPLARHVIANDSTLEVQASNLRTWLHKPMQRFLDACLSNDTGAFARWAWAPVALGFETRELIGKAEVSARIRRLSEGRPTQWPAQLDNWAMVITKIAVRRTGWTAAATNVAALQCEIARVEVLLAICRDRAASARRVTTELQHMVERQSSMEPSADFRSVEEAIASNDNNWSAWSRMMLRWRSYRVAEARNVEEHSLRDDWKGTERALRRVLEIGDIFYGSSH